MDIEDIKAWKSKIPAAGIGTAWMNNLNWLIAEVEKYQKLVAGNSQLQIDWVDVTSKRCAVIAERTVEKAINTADDCIIVYGKNSAEAIRKEFNL